MSADRRALRLVVGVVLALAVLYGVGWARDRWLAGRTDTNASLCSVQGGPVGRYLAPVCAP